MNILLFGPPGAGKGTQSELLKTKLKMRHISTGDLFRNAIKSETELGRLAKSYLDAGQLVPDSVTIDLVRDVLNGLEGQAFILDGFPRTLPQAEALEGLLKSEGFSLGKAVFLNVPESFLVERLTGRRICKNCGATFHITALPPKTAGKCDKCGEELLQRKDDKESVIRDRIKVYEESTKPLKSFYENMGLLVELDGTKSTDEVFKELEKIILSS